MNNLPQNVTSRYARNLLVKGSNNEFELMGLSRQYSMAEDLCVGNYYQIDIKQPGVAVKTAVGVTPEQAVHRCLEKHGVTFK